MNKVDTFRMAHQLNLIAFVECVNNCNVWDDPFIIPAFALFGAYVDNAIRICFLRIGKQNTCFYTLFGWLLLLYHLSSLLDNCVIILMLSLYNMCIECLAMTLWHRNVSYQYFFSFDNFDFYNAEKVPWEKTAWIVVYWLDGVKLRTIL